MLKLSLYLDRNIWANRIGMSVLRGIFSRLPHFDIVGVKVMKMGLLNPYPFSRLLNTDFPISPVPSLMTLNYDLWPLAPNLEQ